ncbi:IQ and ubiquitin-like domain-containing protein [Bactrocera neohumeralis]|uniref:IQ and ubiquitin-like domain-containing protein n=1 Tax=Bactrocera neohumeralis TaxID=98809 RepID=UPI002164F919|nr:IQ and ubiquitin-like domain-containing protein [Bactrocera neohumeralis]
MNCEELRELPNMKYMQFIPPPPSRGDPLLIEKPETNKKDDCSEELKEIPSEFIDEVLAVENVTVKFRVNGSRIVAQVYSNRSSIADIKTDIGSKFEVDPKYIRLTQNEREISNRCLLAQTDSNQFGIFEFDLDLLHISEMNLGDGMDPPKLDLNIYYNKYHMPDFITVNIEDENGFRTVIVEILNKAIVKPFLCGYRDKATGIEYLDAFTQTGPYFDKMKFNRYISRDTQTYEFKGKEIDTAHEQSTQCFQDGNNVLYVSAATDYTITPGKYQTYAQKMRRENKLAKIILIQRNFRRFLIVRFMRNAAAKYRRLVANRKAEEERLQVEAEKRIKRIELAKQFPQTKDDFEMLYGEVQKWKIAELKRIARLYEGPARIAEVNVLLDKEIQLRNGIEKQRCIVKKAMEDFRNEKMLTKLGEPIKWVGYKDNIIHLDLLRTQRVRFLTEVYKDMQKKTSREERLELLSKVKRILLDEREFPDFVEIFDLIQREINLLIHTKYCDVEILRKRQNILWMEMIKFSKDKPPDHGEKRMCEVCKKVKPYSQFALRTRQNNVDTCKRCYYIKIASTDNKTYAAILRAIQRDERKRRCNASFAFVLQMDDIRYIIDQIWHSHSILSKNAVLSNLRLPRWLKGEDWSPWNCICLTESEARNHYRLDDPTKVYDHKMVLEVGNRHMLARAAFHKMTEIATEFVETGQWFHVGLNKQRTVYPPNEYPRSGFPNKSANPIFKEKKKCD